jgi:hypothetical protein
MLNAATAILVRRLHQGERASPVFDTIERTYNQVARYRAWVGQRQCFVQSSWANHLAGCRDSQRLLLVSVPNNC